MSARVIPLLDLRTAAPAPPSSAIPGAPLRDRLARPLTDLRISLTDRCNFRCSYCMPKEVFGKDYRFLPPTALLSFEEIHRLARIFVAQGVRKIRLTGGEPLLRRNMEDLVAMLARLRTPDGEALDIALTTNGALLARKAAALKEAGLTRITVSLDGLDDAVFRRMNAVDFPVAQVLAGIEAAQAVGLTPIKVNMVVKRGVNEQEIVPMVERFRGTGVIVRFIEYMDVGGTNGWRMDEVLPSSEVLALIGSAFPLTPKVAGTPHETARRWVLADGSGEIGLISSVSEAFCTDCTRARLSPEGQLYLCLFASRGHDLRGLIRNGASDEQLGAGIARIWQGREDRYSELRGQSGISASSRIEMSYIGG